MIFLLLGCGASSSAKQAAADNPDASLFSGLVEGATWTYRDDGGVWDDTGYELEEEALIKAVHIGDGKIEFRRGLRWADGAYYGELELSDQDGLRLVSWRMPFGDGEGDYPFSGPQLIEGETVSGDWDCLIERPEGGISTYYAVYENSFSFQCSNGGLEGSWSFAYEIGLVRFASNNGDFLELSAPW